MFSIVSSAFSHPAPAFPKKAPFQPETNHRGVSAVLEKPPTYTLEAFKKDISQNGDFIFCSHTGPTYITVFTQPSSFALNTEISALRASLKYDTITLFAGKWHAQLEEFDNDFSELVEKDLVIFGVAFDVLFEFAVFEKGHVCRKHHQGFCFYVLVLFGTIPL